MGKVKRRGRDGRPLPGGSKNLFYSREDIATLDERVDELLRLVDLRPTDRVLDAGCAEGLVTLEIATYVEHIHGFDLSELRIETAQRLAEERGIENATFEIESVLGYPVEPESYDVTIFAGLWGSEGVGFAELDNLLKATRRQLFARIKLSEYLERVAPMYEVCDRNGFDVLCFPRKFVVAVRRGVDCRIPELPAVILVPTALVEHPIVHAARAVAELEFAEENTSGVPVDEAA